jgi:hypothetical protein
VREERGNGIEVAEVYELRVPVDQGADGFDVVGEHGLMLTRAAVGSLGE